MAAPEPWILQTQATLGTIVKKPKLTDNLLTKPPFRFLHDVVSAVAEHTGFPSGLFEGAELNAKEIKDKEAKITYLTKLIDCVGNALGSQVSVNPKKIVAGHEPERTNALLQALFDAATGDPDLARQGVERTLAGEKPAGKARSEAKPERPQSSSKAKRSDADQPEPQGNASEAFPEAPPSLQEPAAEKPRRRRKPDPEAEQTPPPKAQPREQPRE
jgi:TRAF3-interacting protein 1